MKKTIFSFVALAAFALMTSCSSSSSDGGSTPPPAPTSAEAFAETYFTVQGGTYRQGAIPTGDATSPAIAGITMNGQALASGSNIITVDSEQSYQSFLIGVDGVDGYVEVPAVSRANSVYIISLIFGNNFGSDITIVVVGVTTDGTRTRPFVQPVKFNPNRIDGELHINLTFSNAKDIDLHLTTPSGKWIYYADRKISTTVGETIIEGGLDYDACAGCTRDMDLNNENIVIPAALIEPGQYTVEVVMYENCNVNTATNWTINARYNGAFLTNTLTLPTAAENQQRVLDLDTDVEGSNPVYGCYPINAKSNGTYNRTKVMTFTITPASSSAPVITMPYKPTDLDEMKMEEAAWHRK